MVLRPVLEVRLGDRLTLRKPHPCGSKTWDVVRLGADIGLVCTVCRHRVLLERASLERRLVGFVLRGPEPDAAVSAPPDAAGEPQAHAAGEPQAHAAGEPPLGAAGEPPLGAAGERAPDAEGRA